MAINLPTNLLRSFVAIVDTGSMSGASEHVFVTQSALSLQIRRLEELVQQTLFVKDGRRLALTRPGLVLLDYARRILALHDEAVTAVSAGPFTEQMRIGMVQDFADDLLGGVLARFAELHPFSQIHARVAGTADLRALLAKKELDLLVGFADAADPSAVRITPMTWSGDAELAELDVLPLAVLEKPCRFRDAAIASLDAARRRYRISVETPNLSALRAAVRARLGVTCRTPLFETDTFTSGIARSLPPLPEVACVIVVAPGAGDVVKRLAQLVGQAVQARP